MKVNVKKLQPSAFVPKYAKKGDAGLDLVATSVEFLCDNRVRYGTGLAFEIPEGYVGLLFPRSSICKKDLSLCNSVGVIDSGYRGEVCFLFNILPNEDEEVYEVGDRVGQILIIPYPKIELDEVEELGDTDRGLGGFGSTGG